MRKKQAPHSFYSGFDNWLLVHPSYLFFYCQIFGENAMVAGVSGSQTLTVQGSGNKKTNLSKKRNVPVNESDSHGEEKSLEKREEFEKNEENTPSLEQAKNESAEDTSVDLVPVKTHKVVYGKNTFRQDMTPTLQNGLIFDFTF